MWDFEKNFSLVRTFEGHVHYVMMLNFNPRDANVFASASIDKTIKVLFIFLFWKFINILGLEYYE